MRRALAWLLLAGIGWAGAVGFWISTGPPSKPTDRADIAIVLGAAVQNDAPSPVFAGRIEHAVELQRTGRVQKILFTGGRSREDQIAEARVGADYAQQRGVPASDILIEDQSRTTRENLLNAAVLLDDSSTVLIVSDPLHLRRALAIAEDIGLEAKTSPTPYSRYRSWRTRLPFLLREVWFFHTHWFLRR